MRTIIFNADGTRTVTDARTLADAQAERISAIKAEASTRILAQWPIHQQLNATMRGIELLDQRASRAWTAPEAAEAASLRAMGAAIKAIRTASNVAEAAVLAAKTNDEVDAVRVSWP